MKLECHQIEELTGAYLADQLTVQERFRMEMHLTDCTSCASEISELASFADLLKQGFDSEESEQELSPAHRENLRDAWNQADPARHRPRFTRRATRKAIALLATAASIALASYFGYVSGLQQTSQSSPTIQVSTIPFTMTPAKLSEWSEREKESATTVSGSPFTDIMQIARVLPEYGNGNVVFSSHTRPAPRYVGGLPMPGPVYATDTYVSSLSSHVGLPVPHPNYDFDEVVNSRD